MESRRTFVFGAGGAVAAHLAARKASAADRIRVAVLGVNGRGQGPHRRVPGAAGRRGRHAVRPGQRTCWPSARRSSRRATTARSTPSRTCARSSTTRTSTPSASPRRTTGTRSPPSGPARPARTSTSRSPARTTSSKAASWWRRPHKYNRIVQHGVQLRSSEALQEAVQQLRKGVIGKVYMARGLVFRWRPSIGKKPDEPAPPATLELGPLAGPGAGAHVQHAARALQLALDTGTTATATSATRASTRPTCACGASTWGCPSASPPWAASSCSTTTRKRPRC